MNFYDDMAEVAAEIIEEYGAPTTLKRTVTGAYDPSTGTNSNSIVSQDIIAAVFDFDQKMINGTEIRTGDKRVYASAVGVNPPLQADIFPWLGVDYAVVAVRPLAPAGINVLYEMQVRI